MGGDQGAHEVERQVIEKGAPFYGKGKDSVVVTMPLHDRNGDVIAAVRIGMKTFRGQTEQNALVRAVPIVQEMQGRIQTVEDLVQ